MIDLNASHEKNTKKIDQANAFEIERLLLYMSLSENKASTDVTWSKMNRAYFYGQQANINGIDCSHKQLAKIAEGIFRWRGAFILIIDPDDPKDTDFPDDLYDLSICEEIDLERSKQLAQACLSEPWRYEGSHAIAVDIVAITSKATLEDRYGLCVFRKGGKLLIPERATKLDLKFAEVYWANVVMHLHATQVLWSVQMKLESNAPSIGFFTDPTGILSFLKFREKAAGKNRRDAVIHWVSEHWRKNRHDPDAEIFVKRHLRGKNIFNWHGIETRVLIPESEVLSDEKERKRREAIRNI